MADGTEFPADWDELSEVGRLIFEHLFYFLCSMLLKMLKVFQKVSRHIPSRQKVWKWPQRQTNLVCVLLAKSYHHILCNWIAFTYWTWPLWKPVYAKERCIEGKSDNTLNWETDREYLSGFQTTYWRYHNVERLDWSFTKGKQITELESNKFLRKVYL